MSRFDLSRRSFLRGLGLATGALAVGRIPGLRMLGTAEAAPASAPHSVLLVYLRGGYNALFTSADSFLGNGSFGVREGNVQQVGTSRLFLDKDSLGALGPVALGGIAAIGVRHGISAHPAAQANLWMQPGGASYPVQLAKAMGGTAAIRCAAIGPMPPGIHRADGGVSLQQVRDLSTTIAALGGTTRANAPDRALAAAGLAASQGMAGASLGRNPESGRLLGEAYPASVGLLTQATASFDLAELATAYGIAPDAAGRYPTAVQNNMPRQIMGAEIMIRAGAKVVTISNAGWDTHGDDDGSVVRSVFAARGLTRALRVFIERTAAMTDHNVTVVLFGDFSRSLPGSNHQANLTTTVIGPKVRVGTTGRVTATVGLPAGTPGIPGMWSYVAAAANVATNPFGANPHDLIKA